MYQHYIDYALNVISNIPSHPSYMIIFVFGYAVCLICPVPFLSRMILDVWSFIGQTQKTAFLATVQKITKQPAVDDTANLSKDSGTSPPVTVAPAAPVEDTLKPNFNAEVKK